MNKLGTWTTIDCPIKQEAKAYAWLQVEFAEIGGTVRRVSNVHDFGPYPSFEIDMPEDYLYVDDDYDADDLEADTLYQKKETWIDVANEIEQEYSVKFEKYL